MVLVEKRRLDQKTRLHIPAVYIKAAGGQPNGDVYVSFDEKTKEIKISFPEDESESATPALTAAGKFGGGIAR